jgi:hypothetical protein
MLFVQVGGWGPCGPAGAVAEVGGYLCLYHWIWLCEAFPWLENVLRHAGSPVLNFFVIWAIPTVSWTILCFCVLMAVMKWKQRSQRNRGESGRHSMSP